MKLTKATLLLIALVSFAAGFITTPAAQADCKRDSTTICSTWNVDSWKCSIDCRCGATSDANGSTTCCYYEEGRCLDKDMDYPKVGWSQICGGACNPEMMLDEKE